MFLEKKELVQTIINRRAEGSSDQDIYNHLKKVHKDKDELAKIITGLPLEEDKKKYFLLNTGLLILVGITILFKLFIALSIASDSSFLVTVLIMAIVPVINILIFLEVLRFRVPSYRVLAILTIALSLRSLFNFEAGLDFIINLFLIGGIAGLLFYIYSQVLPNYNPKKIFKDENGNHVLSNAHLLSENETSKPQITELNQVKCIRKYTRISP